MAEQHIRRLILGTAGHVDHGKTSLVLKLTGIDTDRLKQEKTRGITIELGFAHLDLPSGVRLGIVDVPGHERFVRAMVAGAGGIDIVALVVAADEGVMPQTREHFDICRLLGVRHGLVVITKTDMIEDEDFLALVKEDVAELVVDTFLEDAPVIEFSAVTGRGKDDLVAALDKLATSVGDRPSDGLYRLPIDRVFTLKGLGTVVTGTSTDGELRVGDEIEILPSGHRGKVRSLQVHGLQTEKASAGQRTAINLQGIEKNDIDRGEVLALRGIFKATYMFDAQVTLLAEAAPLKPRTRVRVHSGTAEILGRIVSLEGEKIEPGRTVSAQIRLEQPMVLMPRDHFVLRAYSPMRTLGGGVVLHARPGKHRPGKEGLLPDLEALAKGTVPEQVEIHVRGSGFSGLTLTELPTLIRASRKELAKTFDSLLAQGSIVKVDREESRAIHRRFIDMVTRRIGELIDAYHKDRPTDPGMPAQEMRSSIDYPLPGRLFNRALEILSGAGELVIEQDLVRRPSHKVVLAGKLEDTTKRVKRILAEAGLQPPTQKELVEMIEDREYVEEALKVLARSGDIVRVAEHMYFDAQNLERFRSRLLDYLQQHGEIDPKAYKELTGTSRKFTIPIAEYFDRIKVTIRRDNVRVIRG